MTKAPAAIEVAFTPFPEVEPDEAWTRLEHLREVYARRSTSYGGFIVRNASPALAAQYRNFFRRLIPADRSVGSSEFSEDISALHWDTGPVNDLTAHTTDGIVDALVLTDCPDKDDAMRRATIASTRLLFDKCVYRGARPATAYLGRLRTDDVLCFDSSQLHAFRGVSADRSSTAYFLT